MDSCIISFYLNFITQLKQFYYIATKASSRKKCYYYFWWSTWLLSRPIGGGNSYVAPEIMTHAVTLKCFSVGLIFISDPFALSLMETSYLSVALYLYCLTVIPSWISNHTHYKLWDEITYPFPNFIVDIFRTNENYIQNCNPRVWFSKLISPKHNCLSFAIIDT